MLKVKVNGRKIREIILKKNLSQNNVAKRMTISSAYMAQLLNGERCPSPTTRQKFQDYFKDCSFDDLFKTISK